MKRFTTLLLLLTFVLTANAQEDETGLITTEEEYNYVTKGYRAQVVDQGGDLKRGYQLHDLGGDAKIENFTFNYKLFVREKGEEICAVMVKVSSASSGKTYYLCIPFNNQELFNRYYADLNNLDFIFQKEYAKISSVYLANFITALAGCEKLKEKLAGK